MSNPIAQFAWIATFIVAACFASSFLFIKSNKFNWSLASAVLLWVLYSCYETFYIDYPRINIRVDLLLFFPVLAIVTIIGLVRWLKG